MTLVKMVGEERSKFYTGVKVIKLQSYVFITLDYLI